MKFDRIQLIARIDEIQAEAKAAFDTKQKPRVDAYDRAVADWKSSGGKKLAAALRAVADRAAKGQFVDQSDVSRAIGTDGGSRSILVWMGAKDPGNEYNRRLTDRPAPVYRPNGKYAALKKVLLACPDEFVTTTMLKEFGFSPSLFLQAAS